MEGARATFQHCDHDWDRFGLVEGGDTKEAREEFNQARVCPCIVDGMDAAPSGDCLALQAWTGQTDSQTNGTLRLRHSAVELSTATGSIFHKRGGSKL